MLLFGSRGIPFRGRHLMENLRRLLPHTKKDAKMDKRDTLSSINEVLFVDVERKLLLVEKLCSTVCNYVFADVLDCGHEELQQMPLF